MNKDKTQLEARREYIKKRVWKAQRSSDEVKKIAKRLFISERTVWSDLTS